MGILLVAAMAAAFALWKANQGTPEDAPTNSELAAEVSAGRTSLGCDVTPVAGIDGTFVDPPYCTHVHLIEQYCGWPLDEIGNAPTTSGGALRFERVSGTYGFATFSTDTSGTVSLTCFAGDGPYDEKAWTAVQWDRLNKPS